MEKRSSSKELKKKFYQVIFESDTSRGRFFNEALLVLILFSVVLVMLDSIPSVNRKFGPLFLVIEVFITFLFLVEYIIRIWCSPDPRKYIFSFLGIVDFLAVLPLFITFIVPGGGALITIRAIRLLRVYRILKMVKFIYEGKVMLLALQRSVRKILVFMGLILIIVTLLGSLMYVIESGSNGFDTIPTSIYWAIITLTTVGYGDIVPITSMGKFVSSAIMILGYSIIAIPLGMISFEFARPVMHERPSHVFCGHYEEVLKDPEAKFCKHCGCRIVRE